MTVKKTFEEVKVGDVYRDRDPRTGGTRHLCVQHLIGEFAGCLNCNADGGIHELDRSTVRIKTKRLQRRFDRVLRGA